jgi:hypothetical protein
MNEYIRVDNPPAWMVQAIEAGTIEGDVYADGEVWLAESAYRTWANGHVTRSATPAADATE